eukprot:6195536-Pleurochrysis_carterae.AAC.1
MPDAQRQEKRKVEVRCGLNKITSARLCARVVVAVKAVVAVSGCASASPRPGRARLSMQGARVRFARPRSLLLGGARCGCARAR